ncbi:sugar-binding transcriptional regulator [Salinisphaera sp. LB1]|uniref:sugar-binding transcriptional regulator n=1 Tax=Salinisphaera sp. LB1 TaxID=2183911 RepID=UPI000D708966|nr:sugar-binding transcriptional regulator [Salinisphaera sp. LB1]AWN16153.1 Transcriptional regulator [Salinisphaera sp. LB1]
MSREDQRIRVAWFYYIEGLTQNEVAKRVGLSRPLVNQILATCRAEGLIQIRLDSDISNCTRLAGQLISKFGLLDAVVTPAPAHPENLARTIGLQAGFYLSDQLNHDLQIAIGWGETLWHSLKGVERQNLRNSSIASMLGGLTRYAEISAYETATRLADMLSAHCYYMAAPVYTDDAKTRDLFVNQLVLQEVFSRVRSADIALCSVGQMDMQATLHRLELVSEDDLADLKAHRAVGDLLGHYLDADGNVVDCDLNSRVVAAHPADLRDIERVVLASGGKAKTEIISAVLRAQYANVLVTDEATAELLCQA